MNVQIKRDIIRAAVAWERAYHEKVGNSYSSRDLTDQEKPLIAAVRAYNETLLNDDVPGSEKVD